MPTLIEERDAHLTKARSVAAKARVEGATSLRPSWTSARNC